MAFNNINPVHCLIAVLCIASILILGGAMDGIPPFDYCIGKGPCFKEGQDCVQTKAYPGKEGNGYKLQHASVFFLLLC
ncbi:hypothetical protein P8452_56239 [Trifolium repens]|nr:hypothetical protein P8452_56239 [Trifolium repens]